MNKETVLAIVADLLPIAESLFGVIDKIRTQAPDAWEAVSAEYVAAVSKWDAVKSSMQIPEVRAQGLPPQLPPDAGAHATANEELANRLEDESHTPPSPVGLSSAQQAERGMPLAHYTS